MFTIWQCIEKVNKPLYALNLGVYSIQVSSHRRNAANYRRETLQTQREIDKFIYLKLKLSTSQKRKITTHYLNGFSQ